MKDKKIIMYATDGNGNGYVQKIGEFDEVDEIQIRIGMFDKDVVISLEHETTT